MIIFLLLIPLLGFTQSPTHWATMTEISERHEFYQNNEVITKPAGSWETLFGVIYIDQKLQMIKDCVFYRVPGERPGMLKINATAAGADCEDSKNESGYLNVENLKALQFALHENEMTLHFTHTDFRTTQWQIPLANNYKRPRAKLFISSAEFRAPKMILLARAKDVVKSSVRESPKDKSLCHSISDDCEELSASTCGQCTQGWYEIPNGCAQGPKHCGIQECGGRNQPACRKGMRYQRERKKFDCRMDNSFAYCSADFEVHCEGSLAYCR